VSGNKKWKSRLLASGLPFEFDVARVLHSKAYFVKADYIYSRSSEGILKDFSVDIRATKLLPWADSDRVAFVTLLVECKYAHPRKEWLLLPALGTRFFAPWGPGDAIRIVDQFSRHSLAVRPPAFFDAELQQCYKATEVDLANNRVSDEGLRHGIEQLRYAMPRLFTQFALPYFADEGEENPPFVFCPILVTTARLRVVHGHITLQQASGASTPDELGDEAKHLLLYSDYGPDFEAHCSKASTLLVQEPSVMGQVQSFKVSDLEEPALTSHGLATAQPEVLSRYFTQFLVCTFSAFPELIDRISGVVAQTTGVAQALE
jgi:hypothetical protein